MSLTSILTNDTVLTATAALAGAAWTLIQSSDWYSRRRQARTNRALHVLEAAVEDTYRRYVSALKAARADGKLTPEEQRKARDLAVQRARQIARTQGLDLVQELGAEFLDLWIAKLVRRLKGAAV